ncbi:hypothetical protein OPQ81_009229 [Rhizoctonia solani]|nr:hypothetical protein OPQ81_009229 [Rhizoctonia solani]
MRLLLDSLLYIVFFTPLGVVYGNTEILNFESTLSLDVPGLNVSRHSIDSRSTTRLFSLELAPHQASWSDMCDTVNNCPYEVFIKLDLEKSHDGRFFAGAEKPKYSLRVSFPPSPPAQFKVEVLTPIQAYEILAKRAGSIPAAQIIQDPPQTRTMYARVRARYAGVAVPQEMYWHIFPPLVAKPSNHARFHLILDPLLLGFVPKSVVPVIWTIVIAGVFGAWCVRWARSYLEKLALSCIPDEMKHGR